MIFVMGIAVILAIFFFACKTKDIPMTDYSQTEAWETEIVTLCPIITDIELIAAEKTAILKTTATAKSCKQERKAFCLPFLRGCFSFHLTVFYVKHT